MNIDLVENEEKKRFAMLMTSVIVGIYGKPEMSKDALRLYWVILKGHSYEQIESGLQGHLRDPESGQFPPKPADILRHIHGRAAVNAPLAWSRLINAVAQHGTYASVCFDDPLIHCACRDIGGWQQLGQTTTDQLPFVQARFEKAYKAYQERGPGEYPRELSGVHAVSISRCGGQEQLPILIGDETKAAAVYRAGTLMLEQQRGLKPMPWSGLYAQLAQMGTIDPVEAS